MQIPNSAYFVQSYLLITNNMVAVSVQEYQTDKRVYLKFCGNCSTEIVGVGKAHTPTICLAVLDAFTALGFERSKAPLNIMFQDCIRITLEQIATRYESSNVVII